MAKKKVEDGLVELAGEFLVKPPQIEDGKLKTPRWKTGIASLDRLTDGGFPKGKGVALGSEEGVGKTTLLLETALNQMNMYGTRVAYIDTEGGGTYDLAQGIGIDYTNYLYHPEHNKKGKFFFYSATTIQEVAKICKIALEDETVSLVVIDSTTQVTDQTALDEDDLGTSKNPIGESARMWSSALRKIGAIVNRSQATLVTVNQARNKQVPGMAMAMMMAPSGGKAQKHFATIEIWGTRKKYLGEGDVIGVKKAEAIGAQIQLTTLKNRLGLPFRSVDTYVYFGKGVSNKWEYKQWLEEHTIEDRATGEIRPILVTGSYSSLLLPSGEKNMVDGKRARGSDDVWRLMEDNWDEILQFVDDNGGFKTTINTTLEDLED